jgi:hypothetical protein
LLADDRIPLREPLSLKTRKGNPAEAITSLGGAFLFGPVFSSFLNLANVPIKRVAILVGNKDCFGRWLLVSVLVSSRPDISHDIKVSKGCKPPKYLSAALLMSTIMSGRGHAYVLTRPD